MRPEERGAGACHGVLLVLTAALVLLAPLPFGLVEPNRSPAIAIVAGLVLLAWSMGPAPALPDGAGRLGLCAGVVLVLVAALQIVPLPPEVASRLAPAHHELLERLRSEASGLPAYAAGMEAGAWPSGSGWTALSACPEATRRALLLLAALLVIGGAAALVSRDRTAARRLALCVVAVGSFEALYGLAEFLTGHQHIFGYAKRHYLQSVTGTYINKNHFAGLMEMALLMALGLHWDLRASSPGPPHLRSRLASLSGPSQGARGALMLAAGVMGSALLLSFSRSGIAFCALAAAGMFAWLGRGRRSVASRLGASLAIALLILAPLAWAGRRQILSSFAAIPENAEMQGGRFDVWKATLRMLGDHPFLGSGLGTFGALFPHYAPPSVRRSFDHAHNDYLELAAGIGLPAAGLAVALVVWLVARSLRRAREADAPEGLVAGAAAGCAALLLHEVTDFNLAIPANAVLFSVCLGILAGAASISPRASPRRARPRLVRTLAGAAIACLMLVEASTQLLAAEWSVRSARLNRAAAGPEALPRAGEAIRLARRAVLLRPNDADARTALADAWVTVARLRAEAGAASTPRPEARALVREMGRAVLQAVHADPWDPASYTRALVSLEWASRLRPEVEDLSPLAGPVASGLLANAAWLAPAQAAPHLNLAAHFLISGDPEGAAASYRRALELRPEQVASVLRQVSDFAPDPGWLDRIVPGGPEAQLLYGEFLAERGSVERAEMAYGASLRGGATLRAVLRLHDLYLTSCRAPHGVSLVRRALERGVAKSGVEQAELYYALARSLIRLHDPEGAASSLERAAQSAPDRLLYQHALAELIAGEQPAEAIRRWEGLLHRRRASPEMTQLRADIYLGLARAYEREGRTLEALRGYRRVLVDRPDDASVLGRITLLQRGER